MSPSKLLLLARLAGVILLGSFPECVAAPRQMGEWFLETWNLEHGLPNSSVTSIAQTPEGYLWIGTFNGLARFDGVRFVTFNPANTPAFKHPRIQRLFVDAAGTLWINTYDGALVAFRNGTFSVESPAQAGPASKISLVPSNRGEVRFMRESGELLSRPLQWTKPGVWQVLRPPVQFGENALYAEDADGVIWCLTRDRRVWRIRGTEFIPVATEESFGSRPMRITADPSRQIWIRTDRDLFRWSDGRFVSMTPRSDVPLEMRFVGFTREGAAWVVANAGMRKLGSGKWQAEVPEWQAQLGGNFPIFQELHEDSEGGIWFAPPRQGLFYRSPAGEARHFRAGTGLPSNDLLAWCEDREGNIWLGAERGGLMRLQRRRFQTCDLPPGETSAPALSVAGDADGNVFVGTHGNGLWHLLPEGSAQLVGTPNAPKRIYSVVADRNGRIWASAGDEDLYWFSQGELQRAPFDVHGIKALFVDSHDRLWIGTKEELHRIEDGKLTTFTALNAICRNEVRAITEDAAGDIWFGLGSGGLHRYNGREFVPVATRPHPIWALGADRDGSMWIGTFGGGLLRYANGQFREYTRAAGLPDDVICQILEDHTDHLWIGSHHGVFRVSKAALAAYTAGTIATTPSMVFGRHDGLPSLECSGGYQPTALRAKDGTLWFTTTAGAVFVRPTQIVANPAPPKPVVENILVDGQPMSVHLGTEEPRLRVPAGSRHLQLQYTGLSFASPDQVRFRYRLQGMESDWNDAAGRRLAQYSFLRPGTYRFQVAACNSDGVWNSVPASVAIDILPHFWQTWWFMGLAGTAGVAAIAAVVYRVSTTRLRREVEQLERQRAIERDRARIARDIHDDLGAGLTQITLFSELLRVSPPHEVHEHAQQIARTATGLTLAMDEIVWAVNPKHDTLESLVTYLCGFAQEYLRSAGLKCRFEVPAAIPSTPVPSETRHSVYASLKEILGNVLKHAAASEVWLRVTLADTGVTLAIEDNGRGLSAAEPGPETTHRIAGGNGLPNLQERMAALGGSCHVASGTDGRGTRVTLSIPLPR